jgi:glycosyltransferase involved in cell wall biosynthesis
VRVLIGMPDPNSLGGPAACEPPFISELRRKGVTVEEETYVYGDQLGGTATTQRISRVIAAARRLRRRLNSDGFDLLHLNSAFDSRALLRDFVTVSFLKPKRAKLFIKFHGSDASLLESRSAFLRSLVKVVLSNADGIGVLSQEEKANFVRAGWDERKLFVIKNVVERTFPVMRGSSTDVPVLLFIARLIPAKGLADVIQACALLRDRGIAFKLICVGDGPARADAENQVERLGLKDRVMFLGQVPESQTAEFYASSTLLVFPTYHGEGFPMTIFYAAAAGLPMIVTKIRAATDYLHEPENCLWVEPHHPTMLADRIQFLLERGDMRESMEEANRQLVRQFCAEKVTAEYLDVYRRLISGYTP